ncbi:MULTISPECIES: hydantoinase/oxoprolinase family protein [Halolamina]|uniref:Hydantoinase/oxoprolinase n=1 Tax=Halolamina pelagica TaxID=699431 RepID=A0A1I5UMP6_9EURY|nr:MULTISPECIES: hydantoinase/oxoprolinase family protein [Halolamina]NHX37615.1 hypothetical protein [Halolamina sp. R1-12]SFP96591.1 Hydantoinase/oxoprolinase [Halolamina pelagica]
MILYLEIEFGRVVGALIENDEVTDYATLSDINTADDLAEVLSQFSANDRSDVDQVQAAIGKLATQDQRGELPSCTAILAPGYGLPVETETIANHTKSIDGGLTPQGQVTQPPPTEINTDTENAVVSAKFGHKNPDYEMDIGAEIAASSIRFGHKVSGEMGFRERTKTAVANVRLSQLYHSIKDQLKQAVSSADIEAPLYAIRSDGTLANLDTIDETPAMLLSGVVAARAFGANSRVERDGAVLTMTPDTTYIVPPFIQGIPLEQGYFAGDLRSGYTSIQTVSVPIGYDTPVSQLISANIDSSKDLQSVLRPGDFNDEDSTLASGQIDNKEKVRTELIAELRSSVKELSQSASTVDTLIAGDPYIASVINELADSFGAHGIVPDTVTTVGAFSCSNSEIQITVRLQIDTARNIISVNTNGEIYSEQMDLSKKLNRLDVEDFVKEYVTNSLQKHQQPIASVDIIESRVVTLVEDDTQIGELHTIIAEGTAKPETGMK